MNVVYNQRLALRNPDLPLLEKSKKLLQQNLYTFTVQQIVLSGFTFDKKCVWLRYLIANKYRARFMHLLGCCDKNVL